MGEAILAAADDGVSAAAICAASFSFFFNSLIRSRMTYSKNLFRVAFVITRHEAPFPFPLSLLSAGSCPSSIVPNNRYRNLAKVLYPQSRTGAGMSKSAFTGAYNHFGCKLPRIRRMPELCANHSTEASDAGLPGVARRRMRLSSGGME